MRIAAAGRTVEGEMLYLRDDILREQQRELERRLELTRLRREAAEIRKEAGQRQREERRAPVTWRARAVALLLRAGL